MIELQGVSLRVQGFSLGPLDLKIDRREYFVILGPTGSGKTMLLEVLAGLKRLDHGSVYLDSKDVTRLPPEKRKMGFVYQDYCLFPHLTAIQNIQFGLKMKKLPMEEIKKRTRWAMELLQIGDLGGKMPQELSGGERQRVALARALVLRPKVLLLDEPLSALDEQFRHRLQFELKRLHFKLGLTTIHVTHSFNEAESLADRIAVLDMGQVLQVGSLNDLFKHPSSIRVAKFLGVENTFHGFLTQDGGVFDFETGRVSFQVEQGVVGSGWAAIPQEDITLSIEPPSRNPSRNVLRGKVVSVVDRGQEVKVLVDCGEEFCVSMPKRSLLELGPFEGRDAWISFPPSSVHVIPDGV
jgi:molybdate/tungstate transport system ATP-binding protein